MDRRCAPCHDVPLREYIQTIVFVGGVPWIAVEVELLADLLAANQLHSSDLQDSPDAIVVATSFDVDHNLALLRQMWHI